MPPLNGGSPTDRVSAALIAAQDEFDATASLYGIQYNPLQINFSTDLPYSVRNNLRQKIFEGWDWNNVLREQWDLGHIKAIKDAAAVARHGGSELWGGAIPRSVFRQNPSAEAALVNLLSLQKDPAVDGIEALFAGGTVPRREFVEAAVQQFRAGGVDPSRGFAVLDIETSGTHIGSDVRQIAARVTRPGGEVVEHNLHFYSAQMEEGLYPGNLSYVDYMKKTNPGLTDADFIARETMHTNPKVLNMLADLSTVQRAGGFMAGANIQFDVGFLTKFFTKHGAYNTDRAYTDYTNDLLRLGTPGSTVDTRLWAAMTLGGIEPDELIKAKDDWTRYSVLNINLKTSMIADAGPEYLEMALRAHDALADVRMTEMQMLQFFAASRDDNALRFQDLDRETARKLAATSSVTPTTKMDYEIEFGPDDTRTVKMTPLQYSIMESRRQRAGGVVLDAAQARGLMFHGGKFRTWLDDLTTGGGIRTGRHLAEGFADAQEAMAKVGAPFASLHPLEQAMSTLLGTMHVGYDASDLENLSPEDAKSFIARRNNLRTAHNLVGDVLRSGAFETTTAGIKVYGQKKVVRLPLELIEEIGGDEGARLLRAVRGETTDPYRVGVSAFEYFPGDRFGTPWQRNPKYDVALTANLFETNDQAREFAERLRGLGPDVLQERFGLAAEDIDDVVRAISEHGDTYGVQIGIARGINQQQAQALYRIQEQTQIVRDQSSLIRMTSHIVSSPRMREIYGDDIIHIAPTQAELRVAGAPDYVSPLQGDSLVREMNNLRTAHEFVGDEVLPNRVMQQMISMQQRTGNPVFGRMYRGTQGLLSNLPARIGAGVAALGGYYLFRKHRKQQQYDEALQQMPYESPGYGVQQQREREAPPLLMPGRGQDPLATAGLSQALHEAKVRHTDMGPGKYDHLF